MTVSSVSATEEGERRIDAALDLENHNRDSVYNVAGYRPVRRELAHAPVRVSGELPADLDGAYLRNGTNSPFDNGRIRLHAFSGAGMLHQIQISSGSATYQLLRPHPSVRGRAYGRPGAVPGVLRPGLRQARRGSDRPDGGEDPPRFDARPRPPRTDPGLDVDPVPPRAPVLPSGNGLRLRPRHVRRVRPTACGGAYSLAPSDRTPRCAGSPPARPAPSGTASTPGSAKVRAVHGRSCSTPSPRSRRAQAIANDRPRRVR